MTITFPMAHYYCIADTAVHGQEIFKMMIQFPNHQVDGVTATTPLMILTELIDGCYMFI